MKFKLYNRTHTKNKTKCISVNTHTFKIKHTNLSQTHTVNNSQTKLCKLKSDVHYTRSRTHTSNKVEQTLQLKTRRTLQMN